MKDRIIITIGRQYGSGGREIGNLLSQELGIKVYDKEMLTMTAKESGLCEEFIKSHDEKPAKSFLYSLVMDTYSMNFSNNPYADMPMNHKVFLEQFKVIKKIASEDSCILIGRCADYALEEFPNCINIYIHADIDTRVKRIALKHDLEDDKAKDLILKTDKKRAAYYNNFSTKKWGDAKTYDLCIDSSDLGINGTVKFLKDYINYRVENFK